MKTTIDIPDRLLAQATSYANQSGLQLSEVIEEGLRRVLGTSDSDSRYRLRDLSAGSPTGVDPLESYSWPDLRAMIYGDRGSRPFASHGRWKDF